MNGNAPDAVAERAAVRQVAAATAGLSQRDAADRLRRDGPNLLPETRRRRWPILLWDVVREPMLLLLLAAAAIYLLLGDPREALALAVSVVAVIGLTLYQQQKSETALQALRDLSSPRARVMRDGELQIIAARDLVVGDVIAVAEGDRIPADAELLDDAGLQLDESMLTGESVPVRRHADSEDLASRTLHASTLAVSGHGTARVVATGVHTAVGGIGTALRDLHPESTPMQREMRRTVLIFAAIGLTSCAFVVALYVAVHGDWLQALLAGITLAISNIPEEFPVVLAVFLALGGWRMARQRALVRRAPAIEALGAGTVLCTDKTGTLTCNRMEVAELRRDDRHGSAAGPLPDGLGDVLKCARRASVASAHDPMDAAIIAAAGSAGMSDSTSAERCVKSWPLRNDLLAVAQAWTRPSGTGLQLACKGAPEAVAALCKLDLEPRARILRDAAEMAQRGLRVLGVASGDWPEDAASLPDTAQGLPLRWCGLLGLADPLRPGVPEAVAEAQAAGIRVLMLTGDHVETARAIATQAGLVRTESAALGRDLDALEGDALEERVASSDVFARVRPEHKLRLVRSLQSQGHVVAMTGDGVNDAPALMASDIGIAMGGRGTDVAREAASIVLLDDNFVTVVHAIRVGRTIYENIRHAVRYIIAVHVPITGLALMPLLLGHPLVLLPLHVVFLELIVDPSCSIVFEREAPAKDLMRRPPRAASAHLFDLRTLAAGLGQGLTMFACVAATYAGARALALPPQELAALAFSTVVTGNLALIAYNRPGPTLWSALRRRNAAFWIVITLALGMLMLITRVDGVAAWFDFAPPAWPLLLAAMALPLLALLPLDAARWLIARRARTR